MCRTFTGSETVTPALRLLLGDADEDVLAELRAGIVRWAAQDGARDAQTLQTHIGLPATPCALRRLLRDDCLRRAADLIEAPTEWKRAVALAERCRLFELRRWPSWRGMAEAPLRADGVDRLLHQARQHGPVDLTARRIYELL